MKKSCILLFLTSFRATPTVSKSKKKAVPNPVKIASLVIQAAQEADK